MRKIVKGSSLLLMTLIPLLLSGLYAQQPNPGENEYYLAGVNPRTTGGDTLTSDAGRGVYVADNPDLDGDGKAEIIVTEYTNGGRVFVYEVAADNTLEFVWASKRLPAGSGGGSTPRSVTVGDFDNNGMQEIIFPVGYVAADSVQGENRGIYIYEHTGNDDDYGTEPAFKMTFESIDSAFAAVNTGRTESGLRVQDIDGDGRQEMLFPPRSFSFSVAKLYIMQVTSGTWSGGDAVIENEYVYEDMVQPPNISPDGWVPVGTEIGDVDNDNFDEIIVAGWKNIGSGAGLGFIQIDGADSYTPGSIIEVADFSGFVVKAHPRFALVNGDPVIYVHGTNTGNSQSVLWTVDGIIADNFVTQSNLNQVMTNVGIFSIFDVGDQDHPTTGAGDGIDLYLSSGSRMFDVEYQSGSVVDSSSYTVKEIYDIRNVYTNVGGLFDDIYTYPGMDIDNDGNRDIVASWKGSTIDSIGNEGLARDGFHVFMFEWGDSTLSDPIVGIGNGGLTVVYPEDYKLSQNYPNPFNPTTSIDFTLPVNKPISLKVYNSLGQEVKTLINNETYAAGTYTAQWDGTTNNGTQVASGVYLYKLFFGNFSTSKKMTLIR